jgi:hypothetical protein
MKVSTIIKSSICLLGFVGAGNFFASPAHAEQAASRAAVSITNPSSFTQSVSGEVLLPSSLYFKGMPAVVDDPATTTVNEAASGMTLIVTPKVSFDEQGTSAEIAGLSFYAGEPASINPLLGAGKVSDVVAAILKGTNTNSVTPPGGSPTMSTAVNAVSIDDAAAIIKAASGVDGLE